MIPEALRRTLEAVKAGTLPVDEALETLRDLPLTRTEEATIDSHRRLRCGFPEVIYGEGKSASQVLAIAGHLVEADATLLATRLDPKALEALAATYPEGTAVSEARLFHRASSEVLPPAGEVAVVSAGTSDQGVAEEAAWTLTALGVPVRRVRDVGVAGLHRVLPHAALFRRVAALVVAAGMEGALPSVVGGLTDRPVIAVPTSVGYGANLGGLTALFAMLNSCAAGVSVVNIDNGFGAGYNAALIARLVPEARSEAP